MGFSPNSVSNLLLTQFFWKKYFQLLHQKGKKKSTRQCIIPQPLGTIYHFTKVHLSGRRWQWWGIEVDQCKAPQTSSRKIMVKFFNNLCSSDPIEQGRYCILVCTCTMLSRLNSTIDRRQFIKWTRNTHMARSANWQVDRRAAISAYYCSKLASCMAALIITRSIILLSPWCILYPACQLDARTIHISCIHNAWSYQLCTYVITHAHYSSW